MPTSWPFVGRTSTLDEVRRLLRGPAVRGVVVAGDAGVGKTRLVAEALGRLEPGAFTVLQVGATRATAAIPLGAFGHVLPVRWPGSGVVNPLRWASEALRPAARSAPLLVAVDDAHLLDPTSAALIHHLVLHEEARVLATVRTGEIAPDPMLALWKDDLTRRLDLGPLQVEETQAALEGALGGQLDVGTALRLWRLTQGNLLFLRELVLAGRSAGALTETGGVWRWRGPLPVTPRLRELVETRLGTVEEDEQEVLDYVAFGEPLGATTLAALTSDAALERAEDKHLIELARTGGRLEARLAHPIYGEVARARTGGLRARRRLAALAAAVEATGARRREDLLRVAVWRLDSGTTTDPARTTTACLLAKSVYDIDLAERLGRAAMAAGGGMDAALALAGVLYVAGKADEAETVLADVAGVAHTDEDWARYAATRAVGLVLSVGSPEIALRVLDEAAASISAVRPRQHVEVARGRIHAQLGELPAALAAVDLTRSLGPVDPRIAVHCLAIEAVAYGYQGRLDECLAIAAATPRDEVKGAEDVPGVELDIACVEMLSLLFSGDPMAGMAAVDAIFERFQGSGVIWELGAAGFLGHRGQLRRMTGAVGDALRTCREGVVHLGQGPAGFAGLCLGEFAHAAALLGRLEEADRALAEAERRTLPTFYLIDFPVRLARPWVLALRGRLDAAIEAALETAAEAEARGVLSYLMFALHDVVRLDAPERVADRLGALADRMDGALVRVCARHARAAVAGDGPGLDAVSQEFADMGFVLHAAEASAQAARAYERAGQVRQARATETRAWVLARRCQGARTPVLARLAAPELTTRQLEIAQLAGAGLTNREIADRLVLSIRTVANHLGGAYERLGVNDRAALAGLLGLSQALSPVPPPVLSPAGERARTPWSGGRVDPYDAGVPITTWPFVGRTAMLDEVRGLLRGTSARGVVVAGAAGVGKSRLAAETLTGLGPEGYTVLATGGTRAGEALPFGAFAHVLPPSPGAVINPLRWASETLRELAGPGSLLVAVDDAHLLDSASAALIHHLALHRQARILATVRTGESVPDPVLALWKDDLIQRVELSPLDERAIGELLQEVLGGQVEETTARRLHVLTQGNPLFLREVVLAGRASGALKRAGTVWRWSGDLPVSARLAELVELRVGRLDEADRELLELVACGGALGADLLAGLTSAAALDRAEERQLITTAVDGRRLQVRLAHPLYGETAPARERRTAGLIRLAEAVEATGMRRRGDVLRVALWRLDSGTAADPGLLLAAFAQAWALHDAELTVRCGLALLDLGMDAGTATAIINVLFLCGRHEEAEVYLERMADQPMDEAARAGFACARAFNAVMGFGDAETGHRILDEAAAQTKDPASLQALLVYKAFAEVYGAQFGRAVQQVAKVRALPQLAPRTIAMVDAVEALCRLMNGELRAAVEMADRQLAGAADWAVDDPNLMSTFNDARSAGALYLGDVAAADAYISQGEDWFAGEHQWSMATQTVRGLRAELCLLRGDLRAALRWAGEADSQSEWVIEAMACYGTETLAYAAAVAGDLDTATAAIEKAERDRIPTGRFFHFRADLARAWLAVADDDLAGAVDQVCSVAEDCRAIGLLPHEMFALHDAVRLGHADRVAARLAELATRIDGPLVRLFAAHAAAGGGAALDAVSEGFAELGAPLYAAEAAAQAADAYDLDGRSREANAARFRAWWLVRRCTDAATPALARVAPPQLTGRQWEVVRLAARGLGNREIADRLVLSIRTVGNHLTAVYDRLGLNDRADLALLAGLERGAGLEGRAGLERGAGLEGRGDGVR